LTLRLFAFVVVNPVCRERVRELAEPEHGLKFMAFQKNQSDKRTWIQCAKELAKNPPRSGVVLVILVIAIGEFIADLITPLEISDWIGYFIPLLLSVYVNSRIFSYLLAAIFSVLIMVGFYLSPQGVDPHLVFISRCIGICVLWLIAFLIDARIRLDITDRKRLEENFQRIEERYRSLAESSPDAIFILDRESTFQYVNRATAQWLGRPAAELLGRSQAEFFPPDMTRQQQEALQRVFQTGEMVQTKRSRPFQDGEKWVETRLVPLRDQAGKVSFVMGISRDLTERKRADLQLATLAHAVKSTTEMICITDLNDRFIFVNDAFLKVYGYSEAEILGKIPEILLSPKNPPLLMQEILEQSHLSGWRGEVIDRRKDGTEFPIFLSTSQVKDYNGVVVGLMGVSEDITERKRAETILRENEARLRLLTEQVPAIIWTTDRDLKFTSSTGSPLAALSLKNNEVIGLSLCQFFGTTDENFPSIAAHRRALGGERSEREMEWGGRVWHSFIEPLVDNGGKTIGCIGVAVDVTEAKKIEARLQELAAIVQSSEDAIISMTTNGIIINWNNGAKRLLGYAAEEVIGKNISIIVPPEQFEKARGIVRKAAQGESVEMYETVRRHKDGELREVSIKVSLVTNVAGKVISIAAILRDITARKQLEKTVLEISADERRRIGHELHDGLGQHLAGIAFKTKVLEEDLAAESSRLTHDAEKIVGWINDAIQQTRNLARGLDPVDFEVSGLPAALQNLAAQTENVFHIDCIFRCNEERLNLDAQTNVALYRIAQEAINNAIKHGQARRIEIDLKADKPQLSLTIRDKGKGFLLDDKPRLGMGLHIMGYRADTLGGILSIHSEVDVGTEIKCFLPKAFLEKQ
jgi:PAS domain S-box-containing protein